MFAPRAPATERRDRLRRIKQAEELSVVWRYLLGVTGIDAYSREMTALAEAVLDAGWLLALEPLVARHGVPRASDGGFIPAAIVGLGKLGGRELTTGSDLDVFVIFAGDGETDGAERVDAHTFYSAAVERLAGALGDITVAGVAFPVDLRLRPGSKGSGFASSLAASERYYGEYGDLWERQTLTRARLILGERALGRRGPRAASPARLRGPAGARPDQGDRGGADAHGAGARQGDARAAVTSKFGAGGLVDVEFLVQTLQLLHGARHPEVRAPGTLAALAALTRAGAVGRRWRRRWRRTTASCGGCPPRSGSCPCGPPTRSTSPVPSPGAWPAPSATPRATPSSPTTARARPRCAPSTQEHMR